MHTISRLPLGQGSTELLATAVDVFLETLKDEQARFLSSVRQASSLLSRGPGQLAHVAANQGRLTQQFFDAQRQIVTRRAEFDAEVALIGLVAEQEAIALVVAAQGQPVTDSLSRLVYDVFEPDEINVASPQHQLASLLDQWWVDENRDGQAALDRARARAETRGHVAQVEARKSIEASSTTEEGTSSTARGRRSNLSPQVSAALDGADSASLETVLAMLVESLDMPHAGFEPPQGPPVALTNTRVGPPSFDLVRPGLSTSAGLLANEASLGFWGDPSTPAHAGRTARRSRVTAAAARKRGRHDNR